MKKILFFYFCSIIFLSSCENNNSVKHYNGDSSGVFVMELKVKGNMHEYVKYMEGAAECGRIGITHLPECKYCNKKDSLSL